jgi:predicted nuclease of predicted toxin-antitoxin system
VRFVVDNQLPAGLAAWLREQGHHAEHVLELGLAQSKDNPIWNYAVEHGAVLLTKDEDFAEWVRRGRRGPQVVWMRMGNTSNRALLERMTTALPLIVRELECNERLVEVR